MMVLLGSSCLSLAALILQCVPTWLACFFGEATKAMFKICFKNVQFWLGKLGSEIVKNEIAGLRHFLPRRVFFRFFLACFCMGCWRSLGVSWVALGSFEGLMGSLWSQKRQKPWGFSRFYEGICLILWSLWWLSWADLGVSCIFFWILCKIAGPICVSKLHFNLSYVEASWEASG